MVEEKKAEVTAEVQFPLNERLLEEAAKIREERTVIKKRLEKIEAAKKDVSSTVYDKVKADYSNQLGINTNQLLEKKQDIDRELSSLYEAKSKVEENVSTHKERLEEINFRNNLGEFKKEEFLKVSKEENEKLGKFQKILAAIESNIKQYESLFEGEGEFFGEEKEVEGAMSPPPPSSVGEGAPEEEYDVGSNEGYFGPNTEEIEVEPPEIHETTRKDIPMEPEEKTPSVKITIENGERKGEEYKLDKDEFSFGRASSNDIVLKEAKVSRQHAIIKKQGNEYLIEDLHSSNGVLINDEKVKEHALSDGDIIKIGDFVMKFTNV